MSIQCVYNFKLVPSSMALAVAILTVEKQSTKHGYCQSLYASISKDGLKTIIADH
jgi:hypothetical protein